MDEKNTNVELTEVETAAQEQQDDLYHKKYLPAVHRTGTTTMLIILVLTFLPALYLSFIKGLHPGWTIVAQAAVTMAGIEIFTWIMEPTMYFPFVGVTGSYISFVAGNITSMRVPAATAAQNAVGAKTGTRKAEFAGTLGIISSVIVNFIFLGVVILFGDFLVNILPEGIINAFQYTLSSVYGALLVMFVARIKA